MFLYRESNLYKQGSTTTNIPPGSIVITSFAAGAIAPSADYPYINDTFVGIDGVAAIMKHELRHKWQIENSWGGYDQAHMGMNGIWVANPNLPHDKDGDYLKDSWEKTQWGQDPENTDKYFLSRRDKRSILQADNEYDADIEGTNTWNAGDLDSKDWSDSGKQADSSY